MRNMLVKAGKNSQRRKSAKGHSGVGARKRISGNIAGKSGGISFLHGKKVGRVRANEPISTLDKNGNQKVAVRGVKGNKKTIGKKSGDTTFEEVAEMLGYTKQNK